MDAAESSRGILEVSMVSVCLWAEMPYPAVVPGHSKSNQKGHFIATNTGKFKMGVFCNRLVFPTYLTCSIFNLMPSEIALFFLIRNYNCSYTKNMCVVFRECGMLFKEE